MRKKKRIRRYLVSGLVVLAPVGLTVFVLTWVFNRLDSILGTPLRAAIGRDIPGLGLVLLVTFVLLVGWVVHQAAGRQILSWWNSWLVSFPLAGRVYNTVSQIVQAVLGNRQKLFERPVLIPYPTDDTWAIAFVTNRNPEVISNAIGEPCWNVFVPTTPNPTSGFMLAVPVKKIREIDMDNEEATKLVISAGAVLPGTPRELGRRGIDVESLLRTTHDQEIARLTDEEEGDDGRT